MVQNLFRNFSLYYGNLIGLQVNKVQINDLKLSPVSFVLTVNEHCECLTVCQAVHILAGPPLATVAVAAAGNVLEKLQRSAH